MKITSVALAAAIKLEVTTLTTCWVVTRVDGAKYGFTELDADLVAPDGTLCMAASGFTKSNLADKINADVPNVQVTGMLDSLVITEDDLRARRWDYAKVEVFVVDWSNAAPGPTDFIPMMSGNFGTVVLSEYGFSVELRGLTDKLTRVAGELYSPTCRVDLGSARCGINLTLYEVTGSVTNAGDGFKNFQSSQSVFTIPGGALAPGTPATGGNQVLLDRSAWSINSVESQNLSGGRTYYAANLLNNDPNTYWSSNNGGSSWVIIDFSTSLDLQAIQLTNRNNGDDRGSPADFTVDFSNDLSTWSLGGSFRGVRNGTGLTTTYNFGTTHSGRFMRITVQNVFGTSNVVISKVYGIGVFQGGSVGTGNSSASGYYDGGLIHFLSGANAGLSIEMKQVSSLAGGAVNIQLYLKTPFAVVAGDQFVAVPGCDKRRSTCKDKFHNIVNFQGEPDVPGNDFLLSFPDMRAAHQS
jgi:hypothetical protein